MIRPARRADHAALLDLWEDLQANGFAADPRYRPTPQARREMTAYTRDAWFDERPFPRVLVAEADGTLTGFVHGFPRIAVPVVDLSPTARIGDLHVHPDHRRRGIGRALVEAFAARALEAGFPRLEVGTLTADARAVAFWRAMGFDDWQVTLTR
jgi:GNAT superfamily N-acetyltransferase